MQRYALAALAGCFAFTASLAGVELIRGKRLAVRARMQRMIGNRRAGDERKAARHEARESAKAGPRRKAVVNLAQELSCAGIKLRVEEFLIIWAACAFGPPGLCLLMKSDPLVAVALGVVGAMGPPMFVSRRRAKRAALIDEQLSSALVIIGNCLQTGLSFQQAMDSIVREMLDPISREFARVLKEVQLGLSMERALENMSRRLRSRDFELLVSAVLIQRQSGGSLSEVLHNISDTIRERLKIKANLRVLTATGRASAKVVGLMPLIIALVLMVINPGYIRSFFDSRAGVNMLIVAGVLEVVGFWAVRRAVRVRF
jgi:tight adherence protein B